MLVSQTHRDIGVNQHNTITHRRAGSLSPLNIDSARKKKNNITLKLSSRNSKLKQLKLSQ